MKKLCSCPFWVTDRIPGVASQPGHHSFHGGRGGKTMSTLSPPDLQQPGVVSTRLARDGSGQTTRKVAHRPEKTMKKLTPVPDLLPNADWKPGMHQESTGTEVGGEQLFHNTTDGLHVSQTPEAAHKVRNTKFAQINSTLRPVQLGQKRRKTQRGY